MLQTKMHELAKTFGFGSTTTRRRKTTRKGMVSRATAQRMAKTAFNKGKRSRSRTRMYR